MIGLYSVSKNAFVDWISVHCDEGFEVACPVSLGLCRDGS